MLFTPLILLGAAFLQGAAAHAADETLEAREHTVRYTRAAIRSLEKCQGSLLENRELHRRTLEKREAWVSSHVEKRGIKRRSMPFTKRDESEIFKRQVSCVLAPEVWAFVDMYCEQILTKAKLGHYWSILLGEVNFGYPFQWIGPPL